jgi:hypothetical protein
MLEPGEKSQFLEQGYLLVRGVLKGEQLQQIREEYDRVYGIEGRAHRTKVLKYKSFINLIEHPAILDRHKAIFGKQVQLLQYDLMTQAPKSGNPIRSWHRDFSFPGERPLSVNTIIFMDDITSEKGPTFVVPGSHRGEAMPPLKERIQKPLPNEVAICPNAGDAIFINSAIWHSGGTNTTDTPRRGIYMYYGYWWLKPYHMDEPHPWQAYEGATEQRLRLLGVKMPDSDIHMYTP